MDGLDMTEDLAYGAALHWFDVHDKSWYRYNGMTWQGWRMDQRLRSWSLVQKYQPWLPWAQLLEDSRHPYMAWFKDAVTNLTFSALDSHCLEGHGRDVR